MGQSKNGGYQKLPAITSKQSKALNEFLKQSKGLLQESAEGYRQFSPGGQGGQAITNLANQNFQQQTLPSIMNAFGSGSKTSSALNQALASGAAGLNTNLAAQQSQNALQSAAGLGGLGTGQAQLGSQNQFAYAQRQQPFWQSLLLGGVNSAGTAFGGNSGTMFGGGM